MSIDKDSWDNRVYPHVNVLPYTAAEETAEEPTDTGIIDPSFMLTPYWDPSTRLLTNRNWPMIPVFGIDSALNGSESYAASVSLELSITISQSGGVDRSCVIEKVGGSPNFDTFLVAGEWFYLSGTDSNNDGHYKILAVGSDTITINTLESIPTVNETADSGVDTWVFTPVNYTKGVVMPTMLGTPLIWKHTIGWADNDVDQRVTPPVSSADFFSNVHILPGIHFLWLDCSKFSGEPGNFTLDAVPEKVLGIHGWWWPYVQGGTPFVTGDYQDLSFDMLQQSGLSNSDSL